MNTTMCVELYSVNGIKQTDHVSDWIKKEDMESWEPGENIMITADTGKGKSHFIKHTFRDYLKSKGMKCLYLVPRTSLLEQFQKDLPNDDTIIFKTYQSIEAAMSNPDGTFRTYPIIVADESHYFLSDSVFNLRTDLSFAWIVAQKYAIKVFMTATPNDLIKFFIEEKISCRQYVFPFRSSAIKKLDFFWKEARIEELAEQIVQTGNKAMFFLQKAEKAIALHKKFKDCSMFVCSEHNSDYKKYLDKDLTKKLYEDKKFDCALLFATSALDVGISIKDRTISDVVVDMDDPATVIQCIGRKRTIDEVDFASVHIRARTNRQIGGMLTQLTRKDSKVKKFLKYGAEAYNAANNRGNDCDGLIVDVPVRRDGEVLFEKRVNVPKYAKIRYDIEMYEKMVQLKNGYLKYLSELLNVYSYAVLEDIQKEQALAGFLDSLVGKPMLTPADRTPLIERLDVHRPNGTLYTSFRMLAGAIENSKLPYRLKQYPTSRKINGKKKNFNAVWEIEKLT